MGERKCEFTVGECFGNTHNPCGEEKRVNVAWNVLVCVKLHFIEL